MTEQETQISDVWQLESAEQLEANYDLSKVVEFAIAGDRKEQNYLKKLWPECNWVTIKERVLAKGSIWYVFWMDGVNQHAVNLHRNN